MVWRAFRISPARSRRGPRRSRACWCSGTQRQARQPITHDKRERIAELGLKLGLARLNLQFLPPFGRATKWVAPDTAAAARSAMRLIDRFRDRMKIMVVNLPFCFMPGYEAHLTGDLAKLSRHVVFVNNDTVNLAEYLAERRMREPVCEECPHACFCGGFYELEDVP